MSVNSIAAASSVSLLAQSRNLGGTAQSPVAQASAIPSSVGGQTNAVPEQGAKAHHHQHRDGSGAAQASALSQAGTTAAAGTNILDVVV